MWLKRRGFWVGATVLVLGLGGPARAGDVPMVRYLDGPSGITVQARAASQDTPFAIASVGKTMTAVAVLRRVAQGRLALNDSVASWIDADIAQGLGGLDEITLYHLLTMTSGLPDYYTDTYLDDALDDPDAVQRAEVALTYAFDDAPLFDPGARFDYSNTNYVLLGLILEAETGLTYANALQREVFRPAGMSDSFVFGSRPLPGSFAQAPDHDAEVSAYYQGPGFGDGGVISTARDLARFYKALFVERTLLNAAMVQELSTDVSGQGYGMGIEVGDGIVGHSGGDLGFSSDVRMDLGSGTIAILLVAEEDADTGWTDDQMPR